MKRLRHSALLTSVLLATVAATACDPDPEPLVGLDEVEALAAAAQEMTVDGVLDDLGLDPSERAEVEAKLQALHTSMLALHDLHAQSMGDLSDEEKADLHGRLQDQMEEIHAGHAAFMESLSEEQQARFQEHLHGAMEAHHGAMEAHHEAMGERHEAMGERHEAMGDRHRAPQR